MYKHFVLQLVVPESVIESDLLVSRTVVICYFDSVESIASIRDFDERLQEPELQGATVTPRYTYFVCLALISMHVACSRQSGRDSPPGSADPALSTDQTPRPSSHDSIGRLPNAHTLIERAMAAHGGSENLSRIHIGRSQLEVVGMPGLPLGSTANISEYFDLPSQFRRDVKADLLGESFAFSFVVTEKGSWERLGDGEWTPYLLSSDYTPVAFPASNLNFLFNLEGVADELTVLIQDIPNEGSFLVLRAESEGAWKGDIYFDPDTYLEFASRHPVYSPADQDFVEVTTYYRDYRTINGAVLPMRAEAYMDGELCVRTIVKELTFLESLDPSVFDLEKSASE